MLERELSARKPDFPTAAIASDQMSRLLRFLSVLGLVAIIAASVVPGQWRPSIGVSKHLEHALAYCSVASVLTMAGMASLPRILAMAGLAGVLELVQIFIPGREPSPFDFLASSAGAIAGFGLVLLGRGLMFRNSTNPLYERVASRIAPFQVEALAAALSLGTIAVVASIAIAPNAIGLFGAGLAVIMVVIAVIDAQYLLIPDILNAAGFALGVANAVVLEPQDWSAALMESTLRAALLFAAFLALRFIYARLRGRQGLGLGDVKLAAVAGAWLDWPVLAISVEIAALSAIVVYALRRYVLRQPIEPASRMPFGLYFAPAIWVSWFLQTTWLHMWWPF